MRRFFHGAAVGLFVLLAAFVVLVAYARVAPPTPSLGSALAVLKLLGQLALFASLALALIRILQRLPSLYLLALLALLATLYYHFGRLPGWGQFWTAALFVVPASVLGGSIAWARQSSSLLARLGIAAGLAGLAFGAVFFFRAGFAVEPSVNVNRDAPEWITPLSLPDPSGRGSYAIETLTYGSGSDPHRPEFAEDVDLVTESVDGTPFLEGWEGRSGWARTRYWGFGPEALPLQGRVWHPAGEGPFPLVLIVHGNHAMEDFSDPGYGYLGELFASRGFIFVSVDENFINSSFSGRLDELYGRGLRTENDARGWLLLEHLSLWRTWNETEDHPFFDRVDMGRIGLIGHSRGGEAVAVAAAFNGLERYPDDANVEFDFGFDLAGIAAIAPVDGQYQPSGRGTPLVDVNYFVLHGSHDGDVQSFAGSRQFERVRLSGESFRFKSSLYVYGANHGQFNTTWGRSDSSPPGKNLLNLVPILPPEDQRRVAEVYLSAFFEATIHEDADYLPLFRDPRVGRPWLPDTILVTHYEDSTQRIVADFEEDLDVHTTTLPTGVLEGENLERWEESVVELKYDDKATKAVTLGWDLEPEDPDASDESEPQEEEAEELGASESEEGPPLYRLSLPWGLQLGPEDSLVFTLADASEDGEDASENPEDADEDEPPEGIDFHVELQDAHGATARLPLSHYALVQPKLEVQVRKSPHLSSTATSEPVFQSFELALSDFLGDNPDLEIAAVVELRFVFDLTIRGAVLLDNVGFRGRDGAVPAN